LVHLENTKFAYSKENKNGGATPIWLAQFPIDVKSLLQKTRPKYLFPLLSAAIAAWEAAGCTVVVGTVGGLA